MSAALEQSRDARRAIHDERSFMFPIITSAEQVERMSETLTTAQATGRTVAGLDLFQPLGTNILSVRPIFDNGEDAETRYEPGEEKFFAVCGKDITDEVAAMRAEAEAELAEQQTDEKTEVEA